MKGAATMATKKSSMKSGSANISSSVQARHSVIATISNVELVKAGSAMTLSLYDGEIKLGQLEVGRGSFIWKGANKKRPYRMSWADFVAAMNDLAYGD